MKLSDLIRDTSSGFMSHSKLWANIAYAAVTFIVIHKAIANTASDDLILFYLGIVAVHATGSKYVGSMGNKELA